MASDPIDAIPDSDGDVITVDADEYGRVWLVIADRSVALDLGQQERFARAYVTACLEAARAVPGASDRG